MNEKLNLVEILKGCPVGTKLYSTVYGEVELVQVIEGDVEFPIRYKWSASLCQDIEELITKDGRLIKNLGECTLFPSKNQRDWSKFNKERFDPETLNPYDKVLVRDGCKGTWVPDLFGFIRDDTRYQCLYTFWKYCIPFNGETEHLMGTNEEAPEFYRYWEN